MFRKKQLSGHEKRQKKKLEDKFIQSQKGAMHKFVSRSVVVANSEEIDVHSDGEQQPVDNVDVENDPNQGTISSEHENTSNTEHLNEQEACPLDIYDPRTWDGLDNISRDILLLMILHQRMLGEVVSYDDVVLTMFSLFFRSGER